MPRKIPKTEVRSSTNYSGSRNLLRAIEEVQITNNPEYVSANQDLLLGNHEYYQIENSGYNRVKPTHTEEPLPQIPQQTNTYNTNPQIEKKEIKPW